MQTVGQGIAYYSIILMTIGSYQRIRIRLSIQPEAIFSLEFNAANTNTAAISVNDVIGFVFHINVQFVKVGSVG